MLIEALTAQNGRDITAAQLISWIVYDCHRAKSTSQPVHRFGKLDELSATFQDMTPPKKSTGTDAIAGHRAQVILKINLANGNVTPDSQAFKK